MARMAPLHLPVAAVATFLLLLAAPPIQAAPLPLVPTHFSSGRCDPSASRIDCGYYGANLINPPASALPLTPPQV
jgi:hypothetical protein